MRNKPSITALGNLDKGLSNVQADDELPEGAFLGGNAITEPVEGATEEDFAVLVGPPASIGAGAGENNISGPTDEGGALSGGNCCGPEYIWIKSNTRKSENGVINSHEVSESGGIGGSNPGKSVDGADNVRHVNGREVVIGAVEAGTGEGNPKVGSDIEDGRVGADGVGVSLLNLVGGDEAGVDSVGDEGERVGGAGLVVDEGGFEDPVDAGAGERDLEEEAGGEDVVLDVRIGNVDGVGREEGDWVGLEQRRHLGDFKVGVESVADERGASVGVGAWFNGGFGDSERDNGEKKEQYPERALPGHNGVVESEKAATGKQGDEEQLLGDDLEGEEGDEEQFLGDDLEGEEAENRDEDDDLMDVECHTASSSDDENREARRVEVEAENDYQWQTGVTMVNSREVVIGTIEVGAGEGNPEVGSDIEDGRVGADGVGVSLLNLVGGDEAGIDGVSNEGERVGGVGLVVDEGEFEDLVIVRTGERDLEEEAGGEDVVLNVRVGNVDGVGREEGDWVGLEQRRHLGDFSVESVPHERGASVGIGACFIGGFWDSKRDNGEKEHCPD
nr:hypothetical protein Iba_chr01cCG6740 [Ipomoea batatas]